MYRNKDLKECNQLWLKTENSKSLSNFVFRTVYQYFFIMFFVSGAFDFQYQLLEMLVFEQER